MIVKTLDKNDTGGQLGDILVRNSEDFKLERNKKQADLYKKLIEEAIFNKKFNNDGILEFHTTINPCDLLEEDHTDFQQWLVDEKLEIYDSIYTGLYYYWKVKPLTSSNNIDNDYVVKRRNSIAYNILIGFIIALGSWLLYFMSITDKTVGLLLCVGYAVIGTWIYSNITD